MLKIKLFPKGKKHQRTFRIVVAEARSKFNGKVIDDLGFFTPQTKIIQVDQEKLAQWQKNGAQLSFGVDKILNPDKFPKPVKIKEVKVKPDVKKTETPKTNKTPDITESSPTI